MLTCPFVRGFVLCSFFCYQTCEHDVLKTNEANLQQIGTGGRPATAQFEQDASADWQPMQRQ